MFLSLCELFSFRGNKSKQRISVLKLHVLEIIFFCSLFFLSVKRKCVLGTFILERLLRAVQHIHPAQSTGRSESWAAGRFNIVGAARPWYFPMVGDVGIAKPSGAEVCRSTKCGKPKQRRNISAAS